MIDYKINKRVEIFVTRDLYILMRRDLEKNSYSCYNGRQGMVTQIRFIENYIGLGMLNDDKYHPDQEVFVTIKN